MGESGGGRLHGLSAAPKPAPSPALLIIAGAGSGKTNTLAHRVAHLILNGIDPRRMMLLTFSRRAAAEMTRRVERIAANVMRDKASVLTDALTWSGTFHAIGARLLREYAPHLERIYEDAIVREADLAQLSDIATGYPSREQIGRAHV